MVAQDTLTEEIYTKIKRPYADSLYALGIKECDTYLPTDDEVLKMIEAGKQAAQMCLSEELMPKDLFPKSKSAGTVRPIKGPATYHGHGCDTKSMNDCM